jgi:chromosome segregation and condensation protein ScpB
MLAFMSDFEKLTKIDKEEVEKRVEAIILAADEELSIEQSQECLTCPLGMVS